jgi:hypothetical protein
MPSLLFYLHRGFAEEVRREKTPKKSTLYCLVPGCTKIWFCEWSKTGFIKAAADSHGFAHWERYHDEQKHRSGPNKPGPTFCVECQKVREQSWETLKIRLGYGSKKKK